MLTKILATLIIALVLPLDGMAQSRETADLIQRLGIAESSRASRDMPGWSRPSRITIMVFDEPPAAGPGSLQWMREVSDGIDIEFRNPSGDGFRWNDLAGAEVYVGYCSANAMSAGDKLHYAHIMAAGVERCASIPGIADRGLIVTNSASAASETIAEHGIALMLMLTRNLHAYHSAQLNSEWARGELDGPGAISVKGKTMLVLGLGGIGSQVALRAHSLGMRVIGTRNSSRSGPEYVDYVGLSTEMTTLAAQADVVVNALPLTSTTRGIVNAGFLDQMKDGSYYISVGRGGTTDTDALVRALRTGKLHGAGLDVTDPEPLPKESELWTLPNVIITPHTASNSDLSTHNTWVIARENLRRYIRGDKLLNLVDLARGY